MLCDRKLKIKRGYLKAIKSLLKHADQITIARLLNKSQPHISKVFSGETTSAPVLKAAIKMLCDNNRITKKKADELLKQIGA